jgi:hypothetical protein
MKIHAEVFMAALFIISIAQRKLKIPPTVQEMVNSDIFMLWNTIQLSQLQTVATDKKR